MEVEVEQRVDKKVDRMQESWPELDKRKLWEIKRMYNNLDLIDPYGTVLVEYISYPPVVKEYEHVLPKLRDLRPTIDFVRLDADPYKPMVFKWGFKKQPLYALYHRGKMVWRKTADQLFTEDLYPRAGVIVNEDFLPWPEYLLDKLFEQLAPY